MARSALRSAEDSELDRQPKGEGSTLAQLAPWVSARAARAWQAADPYASLWATR